MNRLELLWKIDFIISSNYSYTHDSMKLPHALLDPHTSLQISYVLFTHQSEIKSTDWELDCMLMSRIMHEERWTKT